MIAVGLLTVLVFALIAQAAWLATDSWRDRESTTPTARRVIDYTEISWEANPVDTQSILRNRRLSRFPVLERLLKRLDMTEKLTRDLRAAGVQVQPAEFLFAQIAITTVTGFAVLLALPEVLGGVVPALGASLLAFTAPLFWLRRKRGQRLSQFESKLPEALDLLANSLRAGFSTADALDVVARESNGACAQEFAEIVHELSLGADMDVALAHLIERVPTEDTRLLVSAIAVQRRTGGNLVEVLKQLARTLRDRKRLRDEVRVLTTGPRFSGYLSGMLPVIMVVGLYFLNNRTFVVLVTEPAGRIALAASATLVVVGLFLNSRIAKVEL
jgi:tight adherence protein B